MTPGAAVAERFRCAVCGYVHEGPVPPEFCPVCGAGRNQFEPHARDTHPAPARATGTWRCLNCGYTADGPRPPGTCPVCAAPGDRFEPVSDSPPPGDGAAAQVTRVVIVGAGIAGVAAAEAVRRAAPAAEVVLLSREPELPYYRLNLTRYLAGEVQADVLPLHPQAWYADAAIDLRLAADVTRLDLDTQAVHLADGPGVPFEHLILAAGAHPFVPAIPGAQLDGVFSLRTRPDADALLERARRGTRCVCVGGGLLGLETAAGLARRGAEVVLLEGHAWLMPRQLNRRAGERLREHVLSTGIRLLTEASTAEVCGHHRVEAIRLQDGTVLPTDVVVLATGVRPNSHLARQASIEVNKGVVADGHLRTSHPAVYAAGDVAEHHGLLYGSWAAAQYQGSIAGLNAAGVPTEFGGLARANSLKVLGLDTLSVGRFEPEDGSDSVIEDDRPDGAYARFVFHDGRLVGAVLLGNTAPGPAVKKAVETGRDFAPLLRRGGATAADVLEDLQGDTSPGQRH